MNDRPKSRKPTDSCAMFSWETPIGLITARITPRGIRAIHFPTFVQPSAVGQTLVTLSASRDLPASRAQQLEVEVHACALDRWLTAYFTPGAASASQPVLDWSGRSAFDRRIWELLSAIPFGESTTYGALARAVGNPGAARAVGGAMRRNPLVLVVPCHRVLSSQGRGARALGGFSGGLPLKQYLLEHEGLALIGGKMLESTFG